jgi:rsbT co-antagonist protein RsbR
MSTIPLKSHQSRLAVLLEADQAGLLADWIKEMTNSVRRGDLIKESELKSQCLTFLDLLRDAFETGGSDFQSAAYDRIREMLGEISRSQALQGFTPSETASFVFSVKRPLFTRIQQECRNDAALLSAEMWVTTQLLDAMGLYTTEVYQKSREEVIRRQQEELLELSTPVVKLWDGVLALPIIGTLDSARTQVVMESLLEAIVQSNSRVAIIDITGVPTVDTVVAQHLLKTITAARLMGAECIISGVRPQIAQTIVHLGINLLDVTTKATLSAAFSVALQKLGVRFSNESSKT